MWIYVFLLFCVTAMYCRCDWEKYFTVYEWYLNTLTFRKIDRIWAINPQPSPMATIEIEATRKIRWHSGRLIRTHALPKREASPALYPRLGVRADLILSRNTTCETQEKLFWFSFHLFRHEVHWVHYCFLFGAFFGRFDDSLLRCWALLRRWWVHMTFYSITLHFSLSMKKCNTKNSTNFIMTKHENNFYHRKIFSYIMLIILPLL